MQGHIHRRVRKSSDGKEKTSWYVVLEVGRTPDGKRQQKWHGAFRTKKDAEAARAKMVNDFNSGTYVSAHAITLAEFINEQWLPIIETQVKPSTLDSYRRNLKLHIIPHLGYRKLHDITPKILNEFYSSRMSEGNKRVSGGLSVKTVRYLHTTLHKLFNDAIDLQLVSTNPASRARPPKLRATNVSELRFWTPEQLATFLEAISSHRLNAAFHLAAMTGMRRGEVLGIHWDDIDWVNNTLSVRRTLISVAYQLRESTPKTHKSRVINLDDNTLNILRQQRANQQADKELWGSDYQDNKYIFAKENGGPIHPDSVTQSFDRLLSKLPLPRIRFHDLRHTHATIGLRAGIPVKVISERLGHESPAFTLKQYAHVIPGMQAEAANQIATLISKHQVKINDHENDRD